MRRWRVLLPLMLLGALAAPGQACPPILRSQAVLRRFQQLYPCPSTGKTSGRCPGYVKDHKEPLCLTGPAGDRVENLQWQTIAAARAKDRWERQICRAQPQPCPHQGD